MDLEFRHIDNNFVFTLFFLGVFLLLAVGRTLYSKRFIEYISLPLTDRYFALEGKNNEITHPFNILLFTIQWIAYSLYFYLFIDFFKGETGSENPWLLLQVFTAVAAFVLFKYYLDKLIGHVFSIEPLMHRYLFEKLSYTSLISLVFWILSMIAVYSIHPKSGFFYWSIGVLLLLHLVALISFVKRNYQVIFKNFFYFILYLCALEIAPYVILYKTIT